MALIWSKTFQNINHQLLSWGTIFSAYPDLQIVHRAGRVHSNVDPISRLRCHTPCFEFPVPPDQEYTTTKEATDTLSEFYRNISPIFEERVLQLASIQANNKERHSTSQEQAGQMV